MVVGGGRKITQTIRTGYVHKLRNCTLIGCNSKRGNTPLRRSATTEIAENNMG